MHVTVVPIHKQKYTTFFGLWQNFGNWTHCPRLLHAGTDNNKIKAPVKYTPAEIQNTVCHWLRELCRNSIGRQGIFLEYFCTVLETILEC